MSRTADLAMLAPWTGIIIDATDPCVLHAVTGPSILGTLAGFDMVTACQRPGVVMLRLSWPPDITIVGSSVGSSLVPFTRCRTCWLETGKR